MSGLRIVARSSRGLMDAALPEDQRAEIDRVLREHTTANTMFHGLRTRASGHRAFMAVHVLVPGAWTVQQSHDFVERVEADLRAAVPDPPSTPTSNPRGPAFVRGRGLDRLSIPPSARSGWNRWRQSHREASPQALGRLRNRPGGSR
ncbi:MAG: cation transporter dimerization domain-containing protein [Microthrixaceae bacterium]